MTVGLFAGFHCWKENLGKCKKTSKLLLMSETVGTYLPRVENHVKIGSKIGLLLVLSCLIGRPGLAKMPPILCPRLGAE